MDRSDSIELDRIKERLDEVEGQVEFVRDYNTQLLDQRDRLLAMLERVLDAYAIERTALVIKAEDLIEDIYGDIDIPRELERRQIDRWIDAVGTAPPGVDIEGWNRLGG
jgi:hypothetical protein